MVNRTMRNRALFVLLLLVILVSSCLQAGERRSDRRASSGILFQAFTWDANVNGQKYVWYRNLESKIDDLAAAGVTHVWFPPPGRSVSAQGYMPGDWYDLGHGDALGDNRTLYGNEEELKKCLAAFKRKGIVCLADIVINHRCGSHKDGEFWNVYHHASGKAMWEKWAIVQGDNGGAGKPDSGADFGAAPDIDHTNPKVRADVIEWLKWLKTIGFDGWRFDYVKGYGAEFVKEYVEKTDPEFAVGEYWSSMGYDQSYMLPNQDPHRQKLCDWIDGAGSLATTFDFTTKGLLQEAMKSGEFWRLKDGQGKAAGLIGWWPDHAVTFIDNHDTGSSQSHWPFPADKVLAGYAYIFTHPGMPTIFWDHFYGWGNEAHDTIRKLAQLRQDLGLNAASKLEILVADKGRYAARVDGKAVLSIGGPGWEPGDGWQLKLSGNGWAIWTKR